MRRYFWLEVGMEARLLRHGGGSGHGQGGPGGVWGFQSYLHNVAETRDLYNVWLNQRPITQLCPATIYTNAKEYIEY